MLIDTFMKLIEELVKIAEKGERSARGVKGLFELSNLHDRLYIPQLRVPLDPGGLGGSR